MGCKKCSWGWDIEFCEDCFFADPRLSIIPKDLLDRANKLVDGVEVDLDAPLPEDK